MLPYGSIQSSPFRGENEPETPVQSPIRGDTSVEK